MLYLWIVLGLAILLYGGKFLVDGASALALRFNLSAGLIGLTIVALGTSSPELLVSVTAALKGNSDIALGNVIGSNISNITLVLGITALVYPILLPAGVIKKNYALTFCTSVLFFLLAYNNLTSFWEGALLLVLFIIINVYFFKSREKIVEKTEEFGNSGLKQRSLLASLFFIVLGVSGLYWGAELLVTNAVNLAQRFGISERIIGITLIAVGTSLPELSTCVVAAVKKETDIAIGNILGSNIMNVLLIIGTTAVIESIEVSPLFIRHDFLWMLGFTFLLFPMLYYKPKISRAEGGLLLTGYAIYLFFIL